MPRFIFTMANVKISWAITNRNDKFKTFGAKSCKYAYRVGNVAYRESRFESEDLGLCRGGDPFRLLKFYWNVELKAAQDMKCWHLPFTIYQAGRFNYWPLFVNRWFIIYHRMLPRVKYFLEALRKGFHFSKKNNRD